MTDDYLDSEELRASANDVLRENEAVALAHKADKPGADADRLWSMFSELGWPGLAIPEQFGGLAQRFIELGIVYEELGGGLAPDTFLGTMMCAEALLHAGGDAAARYLPAIAEGRCKGRFQTPEPAAPISARRAGSDIVLDGAASFVFGAEAADLTLVSLDLAGEPAYAMVETQGSALNVRRVPTWDHTRSLYEIPFLNVRLPQGAVLCMGEGARALKSKLTAHFCLALACDSVGGAQAILGRTLEYMKMRQQFGRPIGSFQALKHRCADHKTTLEAAAALTRAACRLYAEQVPGWERMAHAAKHRATHSYTTLSVDAIQLHGGIGFTTEHECHLFLKRARLNEMSCGTPSQQKDAIAESLRRELAHA